MEKIKSLLPPGTQIDSLDEFTTHFTKWNWDYKNCLDVQKACQEYIQIHPDHKFIIFCNHPHVYTLGRGNERGDESLVEFNLHNQELLPFPLHKIHRGGGITFHHPGQWICYPIVKVTPKNPLDSIMCSLLHQVRDTLNEDYKLGNVIATKKLMGVWKDKKKLASIGMGMSRFITEHGIALNLYFDQDALRGLKAISPCGLDSNIYKSVQDYLETTHSHLLEEFHEKVLGH
jgi:lipoyl(octanoyl) transferase